MTSIQPTTISNPEQTTAVAGTRRPRGQERADIDALIAGFAQLASLGMGRNGAQSLGVSRPAQAGGLAQDLPGRGRSGVPAGTNLRSLTDAGMGTRGRERSVHSGRAGSPHGNQPRAPFGTRGGTDNAAQSATTGTTDGPRTDATSDSTTRPASSSTPTRTGAGPAQQTGAPAGFVPPLNPTSAARAASSVSSGSQAVSALNASGKAGGSGQSGSMNASATGEQPGSQRSNMAARARGANPPLHTPKESALFRAQVARGLGEALRAGRGKVTLRLRPHTLGELQVSVRIKGEVVDAHLRPSTAEAHRLLEQTVDALRQSFEARGLRVGRIEIAQPPESKDAPDGPEQQHSPDDAERQFGMDQEREHSLPKDSAHARIPHAAGGGEARTQEFEETAEPHGHGSPGIVYSVADGAARIVMIDALA